MNPEIQRISNDLARARQRVQEIESGQRGVHTGPWSTTNTGEPGAGLAYSRQLEAQYAAIQRFELELVHALLPTWTASKVLERMAHVCPAAEPTLQVLKVDKTRDALKALLLGPDKFFSRTALKEILE